MSDKPHDVPEAWVWSVMAETCEKIQDGTHFSPDQEKQLPQGKYPYVTAKNVRPNGLDLSDITYLEEDDHRQIYERCDARTGDVLLVKDGVNTGDAAINTVEGEISLLSSVCMLRPRKELLLNQFLRYFLLSPQGYRSLTGQMTGTAIKRIILRKIRDTPVPVAPMNEQRRIVATIDELFSDLDVGVAALERIKANLKRYRAAVLKAAVEGRLTEAWRAKHPKTEPATKLLERILAERRKKWEEDQLAKFTAANKTPPKGWREKYIEPTGPDTTDLPELPEGWTVASVDQLTTTITSGSRDWTQYYGSGSGTFIMAQNIRKGLLDLEYRQAVNPPPNDRDSIRSQVLCNDLLVTIVGANTGDVCRVPSGLPEHYVCQSVALIRPVVADVAKYVEAYFVADHGGQKHFRRYIYGQGRPHLGFDELRMTPVVLPPLPEQEQVMAEVEERLSVITSAERQIEANLIRSARLRQSILKRAFEGKLVPQDPTDEPADKLLERIRKERESSNMQEGRNGFARRTIGKGKGSIQKQK